MEPEIQEIQQIGNYLYYLLGFGTFVITIIINLTNGKKYKFNQYLRDFLYTLLSIVLGVVICEVLELNQSFGKLIAILMGLFGSTILSKFFLKKEIYIEQISDAAVKRVIDTLDISNYDKVKSKSTKSGNSKSEQFKIKEIPMDGLIPSKDDYFEDESD